MALTDADRLHMVAMALMRHSVVTVHDGSGADTNLALSFEEYNAWDGYVIAEPLAYEFFESE